MLRYFATCMVSLLIWAAAPTLQAQDTLEIRKAMQALEQGDFESGVLLFNDAIASFPDSADLYMFRGICHSETRKLKAALADYDQAVRLAPYLPEPLLERARLKAEVGKLDDALKDVRQCLSLDPQYVEALLLRAEIYIETNNLKDAWSDLESARRMAPKEASVYTLRAEVNEMYGEIKQAIKEANLAVKLAPEEAFPYATRGQILLYTGNIDLALTDINHAIRLAPYQYSLLSSRAFIHWANGDSTEAMQDLSTYMQADTGAFDAYLTRAFFHESAGHLDKAESDLNHALKSRPSDVYIKTRLGLLYLQKEQYAEVVQLLKPVVEQSPKLGLAFAFLGYARFKLGDEKQGMKDLNRAVKLESDDPRGFYYRALIYLATDKLDNACEDLYMARALGYDMMKPDKLEEAIKAACQSKGD